MNPDKISGMLYGRLEFGSMKLLHDLGHRITNGCAATLLRFSVAVAVIYIIFPGPARANVALPTLGFLWPVFWLLYIPIVYIEAKILQTMTGGSLGSSAGVITWANLISTFVGMPVAWAILWMLDLLATGGAAMKADSILNIIYISTIRAHGLTIDDGIKPSWLIFLMLLFFFMSVLTEYFVVKRMLPEAHKKMAARWSWAANGATYGIAAIFILVMLSDYGNYLIGLLFQRIF